MILADTPTVGCIKTRLGIDGIRAILSMAISEVVLFFNVGKNMNDRQIGLTADLIIERYWYLKIEEIKGVLRKAMTSATVFDRLDGNLFLKWLADYDCYRDEVIEQINVAEQRLREYGTPEHSPKGDEISFTEYAQTVRQRAERGDRDAIEIADSLARFELIPDLKNKKQTQADFR